MQKESKINVEPKEESKKNVNDARNNIDLVKPKLGFFR